MCKLPNLLSNSFKHHRVFALKKSIKTGLIGFETAVKTAIDRDQFAFISACIYFIYVIVRNLPRSYSTNKQSSSNITKTNLKAKVIFQELLE